MSYITKKGTEAMEAATQEQIDYSKILKPFTSGKSYNVRVPRGAFVQYFAHSVYKVFYTTPCTKFAGAPDLYDKAVDMLYKDAKAAEEAGNAERAEELRDQAYQLKAKERYLVGFFNLSEQGAPMIIDLTKNQAEGIIDQIKKNEKRLETFAFTVSKTGSGKNTKTSLDIVIDLDELPQADQDAFAKTAEIAFDEELFEKVLKVADEEQQIKDLEKFGFDVSRLGVVSGSSNEDNGSSEQNEGEDLGF
jgi:hypothetical protein